MNNEAAVRKRYAAGAQVKEKALCCPVNYNTKYLKAIPEEVIDRDYGCGDPSQYLHEGEMVLDLGSGSGKICFIASQVVGPSGFVVGVDSTDEMLELARRNAPIVSKNIGYANVEFRKGRIQDLALDFEQLDAELANDSPRGLKGFLKAESIADRLRLDSPMITSGSVDAVVSNCVINLVAPSAKRQLFSELFRVLKPGGRAVISDIVSSDDVPMRLQNDPQLWSGCVSGALREDRFLQAFDAAGFGQVQILRREEAAWQHVGGIDFRSVTIRALKLHRETHSNIKNPRLIAHVKKSNLRTAESNCCSPESSCC
jgi:SAM-dependent methyltransferase